MDKVLTHWINAAAGVSPWLDAVMMAATLWGVPVMVASVAVQWWGGPDRPHIRHVAVTAGLAFVLALAANQGILLMIHRVRPYDAGLTHLLLAPSADWSFPSDHASAAMAIVAAFVGQGLPRRTAALTVLAVLICVSRVYVGTHYVTDILGGAATGLIAAVIVRRTFRENGRFRAG
jgi:undecaprenyl-diphosphatase